MAKDRDIQVSEDTKIDTDELTKIGARQQQKADIEVFIAVARITVDGAARQAAERGQKLLSNYIVDGRVPKNFDAVDRDKVINNMVKFLPGGAAVSIVDDFLLVSFSWP